MQRFVFIRIIGLLKDGDVIGTAGMQISILIGVDRINFQTDDFKIFLCDLACLSNIFHC